MSLKSRVASLDDVPEAARALYAKDGDEFALQIEGMVPKARLDEFRDNNVALRRDIEAIQKQFEGIDPEQARALAERAAKERDKKLIDAGKVEELLAERTAKMKAEYDRERETIAGQLAGTQKQLESLVIDGALRDAAMKAGVRATAIDDVLNRGRAVFKLQDGKAVPLDGDRVIYGKSGDPLGVAEWVSGLAEPAPHLFEASTGGGAKPNTGGAGGKQTMTRKQFEALPPMQQAQTVKTMAIVD